MKRWKSETTSLTGAKMSKSYSECWKSELKSLVEVVVLNLCKGWLRWTQMVALKLLIPCY